MIICPNFSNPEVAREFEELKNATSEAAAYHIWSLNNGNAIDRAPNGAPSKLFLTLLEHYKGDRTKAIQAKAKVYGNSFLNWFGDWTGNATYEVYQGRTSEQPDGRRYNYWSRYENDAKTYGSNVRKVRINPSGFLFKREQRWRTNLQGERVFDWAWSEEYEQVIAEFKEKTGHEHFDILDNSKEGLKKQNEFFEFLESKGYKGYAEFNELELQGVEHDNPYTVTFGDNGVIDSDVSKVVDENGEPLVVYHGGKSNFSIFETKIQTHTTKIGLSREEAEKEALKLFTNNEIKIIKDKSNEDPFAKLMEDPFGDTKNEDDILYDKFLAEAQRIYKNSIKEVPQYRIGSFFTTDLKYAETYGKVNYPVFLNIKNPDYSNYIHSMYTSESQINKLKKEGYDGIYGHDVKGRDVESNGVEYVAFTPNQIKSATDNQGTTPWEGTYSRLNNDIYDMTKPERELDLKDYLKSLRNTLNC